MVTISFVSKWLRETVSVMRNGKRLVLNGLSMICLEGQGSKVNATGSLCANICFAICTPYKGLQATDEEQDNGTGVNQVPLHPIGMEWNMLFGPKA